MRQTAYLVSFIGFHNQSSSNGATIIVSNERYVERDATEICRALVLEQYREQFAVTSIVPLKRDATILDAYGNQVQLLSLLLRQ